ncbi:hypothetical protein C5L38_33740 (plasmid) [Streptomyces sp. WAC00288]|uniref:hypothetical protein n=1 Tax=unclassified Streptomyces TaxID=2593676 RepID=UPI0007880FA6|nr:MULTISPECIES: hypothetical protein [unclassified Streptomyces]AVI00045.1 hypothetical protein C5L38_33740 [Streptomyces sp. WAC00288]KYG51109.1 hypothetical protein AWI43_32165 [Streptomyces sp. WAC04657]
MDTSELYRSLGLTPRQLNSLFRDLDDLSALMRDLPSTGGLDGIQAMARDAVPLATSVSSMLDRLREETSTAHAVTQQAVAALEAAGISTAIADTLDLSWLQGSLRPITDTVAEQDWFAEQVQEVYASDLLDRLVDEDAAEQAEEVSDETAADLEASAIAFREQVAWLPVDEQKRLFVAFVLVIAVSVLSVASVLLDGPAAEVVGNAANLLELAMGAAFIWSRLKPRTGDGDGVESPESAT